MAALYEKGMSVRLPSWHKSENETIFADYPGREEAMEAAGHNWLVMENPVAIVGGNEIPDWKALTRSDTGAVLAVVRDSYEPIQNAVLWDVVDALVAQPNVKYETAGVLRGGCTLWVLAKLDEPWTVPGDDSATVPFVSVGTAHDGSHATEAMAMAVRIVCWNTYQAARDAARKRGMYYSFRHTAKVADRIEQARGAMTMVRAQFEGFKEMATELAKTPITDQGMADFINEFIPMPIGELATTRAVNFVEQAREKFASLFGGPTIPEAHRRTSYGLYCAGIEFLDHLRAFRSRETYFRRTVEPTVLKQQVAKLALAVAD